MEEDQNSEVEEVTTQDQESTIVDNEAQVDSGESQVQAPEQDHEDNQDRNWREMRRKNKEDQNTIKMHEEFIKQILQAQQSQVQQVQQQPQVVDELDEIPDDEFLTKAQSRKVGRNDARNIAREEFQRLEKERDEKNFVSKLKSIYPDYEDVVNSETIAIFENQKPELAQSIAASRNNYQMGLQTYEYIKALNISPDQDDNRHAKEVQKKIDRNEKAVQSPQAYNKRPMAQAFSYVNMSEDEKLKLYNETLGYASQAGSGY